jgi:nucleotide-binding universal stress UspA family protein
MYSRVLLAYDGSLEGRIALREGALLARALGAQVALLAVTQPIPDASGATYVDSEQAQAIFNEGVEKAKEFGLTVTGEIVSGDPINQISDFAKKIGADLVVVGHRKQSPFERWWSGPSKAILSDKLDCSLLIARNEVEAPRTS